MDIPFPVDTCNLRARKPAHLYHANIIQYQTVQKIKVITYFGPHFMLWTVLFRNKPKVI